MSKEITFDDIKDFENSPEAREYRASPYGITISLAHLIGHTVYLVTDREQLPRIVTGIQITEHQKLYQLSCGTSASWHYYFEISSEKDILKTLTNE